MILANLDSLKDKRADYIASGKAQSYDDMTAVGKWLTEAEGYDALIVGEEYDARHYEVVTKEYRSDNGDVMTTIKVVRK